MTTYLCLKDCGLFRQGQKYTFAKPTALALAAMRGGFLKPLATGGPVKRSFPAVMGEKGPEAAIPAVAKKRGRPRRGASAVGEAVEEAP